MWQKEDTSRDSYVSASLCRCYKNYKALEQEYLHYGKAEYKSANVSELKLGISYISIVQFSLQFHQNAIYLNTYQQKQLPNFNVLSDACGCLSASCFVCK